jgi:hypothetical protein
LSSNYITEKATLRSRATPTKLRRSSSPLEIPAI